MRKFLATTMVALLALTLAIAVVGCAQQSTEDTSTTPPPATETQTMPESTMADTSMGH
jgi:hypothetical protein